MLKYKSPKEFFENYDSTSVSNLFKEITGDKTQVIFNKTYKDDEVSFSFRKWYMKYYKDPTEIQFVDEVLAGRYDILENIKKNNRSKVFYKNVRLEAEQRRLAEAVRDITEIANDPTHKARITALKYLCDNGFVEKDTEITRGRPSKLDKQKAVADYVREMTEDEADLERLQQYN